MVWNAFTGGRGWNPWRELDPLNDLFSKFPPIELWTSETGLVLRARLPGVSAADIDLSVVGDTLTLQGKRSGRETTAFTRKVELPFSVESDQVRARFQNGVLEVSLPRAASTRPHKIQVQSA